MTVSEQPPAPDITAAAAIHHMQLALPTPTGDQLKAARVAAGLSQAQAAELMGYPLQTGSRGGVQSRTWQALESTSDERNMQAPVFALFLLLTGQHPAFYLAPRADAGSVPGSGQGDVATGVTVAEPAESRAPTTGL